MGLGAVAVLGDGREGTDAGGGRPDRDAQPARPWAVDDELARYTDDGELELRDGVTVLQRIDEPAADAERPSARSRSPLERDGLETWWLLQWDAEREGRGRRATRAVRSPP